MFTLASQIYGNFKNNFINPTSREKLMGKINSIIRGYLINNFGNCFSCLEKDKNNKPLSFKFQ